LTKTIKRSILILSDIKDYILNERHTKYKTLFCRAIYGAVFLLEVIDMETRVAVMGIIVENTDSVHALNEILHEYGSYIIGRMGIPYRKCNISVMSIVIDAPQDTIASMAGKIGGLNGISVKTAYSNIINSDE
jgi:putative iron-only hydrogenase system regulator